MTLTHRRSNHLPALLFVVALLLSCCSSHAFVSRPFPPKSPATTTPHSQHDYYNSIASRPRHQHQGFTALSVIADAEQEEAHKSSKRRRQDDDDDESNNNNKDWIPTLGGFLPNLPTRTKKKKPLLLVEQVTTMHDYKRVVVDEKDCLVCVRFYAPWCRACRAVQRPYRKMAQDYAASKGYNNVKFVEVPLTQDNAFLHDGLGVPSLPFGHLYHPDVGLVEERKLNKKVFGEFKKILQCYVDGECPLPEEDNDDSSISQ